MVWLILIGNREWTCLVVLLVTFKLGLIFVVNISEFIIREMLLLLMLLRKLLNIRVACYFIELGT